MRTALRTVVLLLTFGLIASPAYAADATTKGITVSATGSIKVTPDAATVNYSISIVSATSALALDAVNSLQKQARAVLINTGAKAEEIATTNISINPEYQYVTDKAPIIIGYRASVSTSANYYVVTKAASAIDALAALSSDIQIGSIALFVADPSKYEEQARSVAVKRAKVKAASYAKLLDRKLGTVQYLTENAAPITPIYAAADFAKGEATVIDAGKQTISVSVEVRWSLR